jgi:DNA-binding transcriptional ArsR family regulator
MAEKGLDNDKIVKVLDHPVRRRIIELLGAKGPLPWKELASELGMATVALYYHLDTLEGIVFRDSTKKYALTKPGEEIFAYLQKSPLITSVQDASFTFSRRSYTRYFVSLFVPRTLLDFVTGNTRRSFLALILLTALFLSALIYSGDALHLFYLGQTRNVLQIVESYASSLIAIFVISYAGTLIFFRVRANPALLAVSTVVSLLPVIFLATLLTSVSPLSALLADRNALTIFVVFFQAWSTTILSAGISVSSGVRVEKSILVSLVVLYATMILVFLQGQVG